MLMCVFMCVLQETGAAIRVFTECCPMSTDRLCQLTGKPSAVVICVGRIIELVDSVSVAPILVCLVLSV